MKIKKIIKILTRDGVLYTLKRIVAYTIAHSPLTAYLSFSFYKGTRLRFAKSMLTYVLFADHLNRNANTVVIEKFVHAGSTVIDVGAHIGSTALVAAVCAGVEGKVYAIEPSPRFFAILQKNIALNKKLSLAPVTTLNCALGHTGGVTVHLNESVADDTTNYISTTGTAVPQRTLDSITSNIPRIDFLKIDVEGYEVEVLKGATKTLPKTSVAYVEFYTNNLTHLHIDPKKVIDMLLPHFTLFTYGGDTLIPFIFQPEKNYAVDLIGLSRQSNHSPHS